MSGGNGLGGGGGVVGSWGVKMVTPISFLSRSQSIDKVDGTLAIDV